MPTIKEKVVKIRPPRIAVSLMGVAGIIYGFFPAMRSSFWRCLWGGFGVLLLGTAVMLWAWAEFQGKDNPIRPTDTPVTLIRSGPFRFSRNPMYLGMLLMLLSPLAALGSPLFLFPPLVFFGVIDFVFIPYEEKTLEALFKEAFSSYSGSVRRWL